MDQNVRLTHGKKAIIIIYYNEKCFWGIILQAYTKQCKYIGINKFDFTTFHQDPVNKVMGIGFVAAYFDITPENG